jgi:hypothetical protein
MTAQDDGAAAASVSTDDGTGFDRLTVDGVEVPAALLVQFLLEAASEQVDITDFSAALAPGQASGLLPWTQANDVSFEALLKAIVAVVRAATAAGRTTPSRFFPPAI